MKQQFYLSIWKIEKNRDINKHSMEGTVSDISSCILGLEGIVFALRSTVTTFFQSRKHKGRQMIHFGPFVSIKYTSE